MALENPRTKWRIFQQAMVDYRRVTAGTPSTWKCSSNHEWIIINYTYRTYIPYIYNMSIYHIYIYHTHFWPQLHPPIPSHPHLRRARIWPSYIWRATHWRPRWNAPLFPWHPGVGGVVSYRGNPKFQPKKLDSTRKRSGFKAYWNSDVILWTHINSDWCLIYDRDKVGI